MSRWQAPRHVAAILKAMVWAGSSVPVFNAVQVSDHEPKQGYSSANVPYAIVWVKHVRDLDDEHADVDMTSLLEVSICHDAFNDAAPGGVGTSSILGYGSASRTSSVGRSVTELEAAVRTALAPATDTVLPFVSKIRAGSTDEFFQLPGAITAKVLRLEIEAYRLVADNYYDSPFRVKATANGGGSVTFKWSSPESRFDWLSTRIRYLAGSTAPTDVTGVADSSIQAGTDQTIKTATSAITGYTVTGIAAGSKTFTWFSGYDELSAVPATAGRWSSQRPLCSFTLTVT